MHSMYGPKVFGIDDMEPLVQSKSLLSRMTSAVANVAQTALNCVAFVVLEAPYRLAHFFSFVFVLPLPILVVVLALILLVIAMLVSIFG